MMVVIEVYIAQGADADSILSEETKSETGAKVLTLEQAQRAGFSGFQPDNDAGELRLIPVQGRDARFVVHSIERCRDVVGYKVHEVY